MNECFYVVYKKVPKKKFSILVRTNNNQWAAHSIGSGAGHGNRFKRVVLFKNISSAIMARDIWIRTDHYGRDGDWNADTLETFLNYLIAAKGESDTCNLTYLLNKALKQGTIYE